MDLHGASSNTIPSLLPGAGFDVPIGPTILPQTGSPGDLQHEQVYVNNTG